MPLRDRRPAALPGDHAMPRGCRSSRLYRDLTAAGPRRGSVHREGGRGPAGPAGYSSSGTRLAPGLEHRRDDAPRLLRFFAADRKGSPAENVEQHAAVRRKVAGRRPSPSTRVPPAIPARLRQMRADIVGPVDADPELAAGLTPSAQDSGRGTEVSTAILRRRLSALPARSTNGVSRPARAVELEHDLGEGLGLALRVDAVLVGVRGDLAARSRAGRRCSARGASARRCRRASSGRTERSASSLRSWRSSASGRRAAPSRSATGAGACGSAARP